MTASTDWQAYYGRPFCASGLSRRYTRRVLLGMMERFIDRSGGAALRVAELGGGGSCFLQSVLALLPLEEYHVFDTSAAGLERVRQEARQGAVRLHQADVLDGAAAFAGTFDLVFSVGLVEHFDAPGTAKAIDTHFEMLRAGGLAIISYPTPTWSYRLIRGAAEAAGVWRFPDERPLRGQEVLPVVARHGQVLGRKLLWPILLTQEMIAARKR
ncbi:MAG: class I SAM-dependent methyltransferase [Planctomycetaceae bacterium]|nr:class I SAM-dependent methyltransferase [Planctomycetaceae bacterium]